MATKLRFHMLSFLTEVTSWHCPFNIYQHSKYMGKSSRIFWLMSEAYSKPCYTSNMIHFAKIVNSFQLSVVNCLRKKLYLRSLKGINLWMIFAEAFYKKSVLRNFSKFTGKHLCQSLFSTCFRENFVKISKNTFSDRHLRWLLLSSQKQ